jgi:putative GTP pyrophosphokinase
MPSVLPRVAARIRRVWHVVTDDDYIATPKEDGYMALHLVVRRDYRLIEIQLRTPGLHFWAELVDDVTALTPSM